MLSGRRLYSIASQAKTETWSCSYEVERVELSNPLNELVKIIHKTTPLSWFDRSNKGGDRYRTADWMVLLVLILEEA